MIDDWSSGVLFCQSHILIIAFGIYAMLNTTDTSTTLYLPSLRDRFLNHLSRAYLFIFRDPAFLRTTPARSLAYLHEQNSSSVTQPDV